MSGKLVCLATAMALSSGCARQAQAAAPLPPAPLPAPTAATPSTTPPAPAFKADMTVTDRTGAAVGPIKTLAESDRGAIVVVEIDGKLIGVPQSTLKLEGEKVISSQTKAEMIAAAGAPG